MFGGTDIVNGRIRDSLLSGSHHKHNSDEKACWMSVVMTLTGGVRQLAGMVAGREGEKVAFQLHLLCPMA